MTSSESNTHANVGKTSTDMIQTANALHTISYRIDAPNVMKEYSLASPTLLWNIRDVYLWIGKHLEVFNIKTCTLTL